MHDDPPMSPDRPYVEAYRCGFGRFLAAVACVCAVALSSCSVEAQPDTTSSSTASSTSAEPSLDARPSADASSQAALETERDWAIARATIEHALEQGLDERPIGELVAAIAETFVGTPYAPGTLEVGGPERLVVNLRTFDCVTLVEHVLVLARLTMSAEGELVADEAEFRERYRAELTRLRYRDGVLAGYPSRLHYFSEWIGDADRKGFVRSVTRELGGVADPRPIEFMTQNPDGYRQLGDPAVLSAIREMEERLNREPRWFIPEDRIADREGEILDGDVIAAVSTLDGLDIAHTGFALWQGDRLHLLHAPLVGDSVEISERPLAERIQGFSSQMGIMVARPLQP